MVEPIFMEQEEYNEYLKKQAEFKQSENTTVGSMTLYDLNKTAVRSLKKMNNMDVNRALEKVKDWYNGLSNKPKYFMFLNKEHNYYTLFVQTKENSNVDNFIHEFKDLLMNWYADKDIRAIDYDNASGAIETWAMWDGEPTVAYLFPYDEGVVEY